MLELEHTAAQEIQRITLTAKNRAWSMGSKDIVYISAHGKDVIIHTAHGEIEMPVLLKDISRFLPPDMYPSLPQKKNAEMTHRSFPFTHSSFFGY